MTRFTIPAAPTIGELAAVAAAPLGAAETGMTASASGPEPDAAVVAAAVAVAAAQHAATGGSLSGRRVRNGLSETGLHLMRVSSVRRGAYSWTSEMTMSFISKLVQDGTFNFSEEAASIAYCSASGCLKLPSWLWPSLW